MNRPRFLIGFAVVAIVAALVPGATAQAAKPQRAPIFSMPMYVSFDTTVGTPESQTITFTNVGNKKTGELSVSLTNPMDTTVSFESKCVGKRVKPGKSCNTVVTYTPTSSSASNMSLMVEGPAQAMSTSMSFTATQAANPASLTASPSEWSFGSASSSSYTFTFTNNTMFSLTGYLTPYISSSGSDYSAGLAGTCAGQMTVPAGGSCTVVVNFQRTGPGASSADISVKSDGTVASDSATAYAASLVPDES